MKRSLNLFPTPLRVRLLLRSRVRQWLRLAAAAAGLALVASYGPLSECARNQSLLSNCEAQAGRLSRMQSDTSRMKSRLTQNKTLQDALALCQDDGLALRAFGIVGRTVREMDVDVRLRELEFSRMQVMVAPPPGSREKPQPEEVLNLSLFGITPDQLSITQFVTRLRKTGIFEVVEAKPMGGGGAGNQHVFRIEGRLRRPKHAVAQK